jgi:hypothetical protein
MRGSAHEAAGTIAGRSGWAKSARMEDNAMLGPTDRQLLGIEPTQPRPWGTMLGIAGLTIIVLIAGMALIALSYQTLYAVMERALEAMGF